MIDSVLKGTGNSRFLKSAVPAGTSWADALAMLQAGTFPIDFNGINTEGFQQVGTPLNKANLLKDATAAQIGLPPSTTPDGMFQALGNTGELHVWRKTVVTGKAGYNLGSPEGRFLASGSGQNSNNIRFTVYYSSSISVSDAGEAVLVSPENITYAYNSENSSDFQQRIRGKFIKIELQLYVGYPQQAPGGLMFIPTDATLSYTTSGTSLGYPYDYCYIVDKMQIVQPYGVGTTTTYPVSTNPKAYQEGDDAKAAGYVLEASKQMIAFKTTNSSYKYYAYNYAESISVSDDGTVSLVGALKASGKPFQTDSFNAAKGKFCQFIIEDWFDGYVSTEITGIVFIPSDAVFSVTSLQVTCSKVQPVTGYAAIPAGTTIEYLGKLGDKARVQVVSYVGTGTYGSSNPNSLTFDFAPKVVLLKERAGKYFAPLVSDATSNLSISTASAASILSCAWNNKTVSWYADSGSLKQLNDSGAKYIAIAIG